jgi:nitroreductase
MEFFEVTSLRHSIRRFKSKPVEEEKLAKILETANKAPSAGNLQPFEIVVVKDQKSRIALAEAAYGQDFISQAPVVLVFVMNPSRSKNRYGKRGRDLYTFQDTAIACAYAQLAITALGLSTCWVGAFDDTRVAKVIKADGNNFIPSAILPIGYPNEEPYPTPRRPLSEIVHQETL